MQGIDNKHENVDMESETSVKSETHENEETKAQEKPKRQLTEAQRLAFLKGREKRMANLEVKRQEKEEALKAGLMSPPPPKRKAPAVTMDDSYADIIAQRVIDKLSSVRMPTPSPSPPKKPSTAPAPAATPAPEPVKPVVIPEVKPKRPYVRKTEPKVKVTLDEPAAKTPEQRRTFSSIGNFSWA